MSTAPRPPTQAQGWQKASAALGASGIAAAAFGAHGLEKIAGPDELRWWAIAAAIQLVTAPVLLLVAIMRRDGRAHRAAAWLLCLGILLFSGTLYAMAMGAPGWLGAVTPIGGLSLIAGWLTLALNPRR